MIIIHHDSSINKIFISETYDNEQDTDYIPSEYEEEDSYDEMDDPTDETADRCFLVYESQLQFLLKHCPKCGGKIDVTETKEVATKGSLFVVSLVCVHGCVTKWKSQPPINSYISVGNLDLTNAVVLSGMYAF